MKSLVASLALFSALLVIGGCGANKQVSGTGSTNMTDGPWIITATNAGGVGTTNVITTTVVPNGTPVPATSGTTSCNTDSYQDQPPYESLVGPVCFNALGGGSLGQVGNISATAPGEPLGDLMIGVSANPAPNGSTFNFMYLQNLTAHGMWQIDGTGTINNGTASGTWACDPSTSACSGVTGTFTAVLQ